MARRTESDIRSAFGQAVRDIRQERGLSQEGLAERAGMHRTYVGSVERGERNIALLAIGRLAKALDVTMAELLGRVERLH